jgi:rubrerythrin
MEGDSMAIAYSGTEIVEIAVQIESCGEAYYEEAMAHARSDKAKDIFAYLRTEERRHAKIFTEMLSKMADVDAPWRHDEDYQTYMRALAENRVFPTPEAARETVRGLSSDASAIRYALGFEKDTILFFYELRSLVRDKDQAIIDELIEEERRHIRQLNGLLKGLE